VRLTLAVLCGLITFAPAARPADWETTDLTTVRLKHAPFPPVLDGNVDERGWSDIAGVRVTGEEPAGAAPAKTVRDLSPGAPPKVGDLVEATVDKIEPFGLFVRFQNGRGLIPNVEMGTPKGADHRKLFPVGTTFKAAIIEIDGQGRLKLSKTGAEQAEERAEYRAFMKEQQKSQSGGKGFGTLGDLLKSLKK